MLEGHGVKGSCWGVMCDLHDYVYVYVYDYDYEQ